MTKRPKPMTKAEVFEIINSENALEDFKAKVGAGSNLQDNSEAKSVLVASLIDASNRQIGPGFLIDEIKAGNIDVYPETALFKTIKKLPSIILDKIVQVGE